MKRTSWSVVLLTLLVTGNCRQAPPVTDTHGLAEEVHHKPELARQIIAQVVEEPHGVAMIAEELSKNERRPGTVVDELMRQPQIAHAIADRCGAARIAAQVTPAKP